MKERSKKRKEAPDMNTRIDWPRVRCVGNRISVPLSKIPFIAQEELGLGKRNRELSKLASLKSPDYLGAYQIIQRAR
jgi:hypothetical protein